MHRNAAELLAALSSAESVPARSAADAMSPVGTIDIATSLGGSRLLLDLLVICFFALAFPAAYSRTREWVQKNASAVGLSQSSAIKKADAGFHIAFYLMSCVAGILCIWSDADVLDMCVCHMHASIRANICTRILDPGINYKFFIILIFAIELIFEFAYACMRICICAES